MRNIPHLLIATGLSLSALHSAEVFSENFEKLEAGSVNGQGLWNTVNDGYERDGVVTEGVNSTFSDGNQALHFFRKIAEEKSNYISLVLEEVSGGEPFVVTWDWMSGMYAAGASNPTFTLYDGSTRAVHFTVHHTTNQIRFYEEGGETKDGAGLTGGSGLFDPKVWYRFRLAVDPKTATYGLRVWANGDEKPMIDVSGIKFENPVSGFSSLRFAANVPPEMLFSDGYYFDNITIQTAAQ